jgi:uncharacterized protein
MSLLLLALGLVLVVEGLVLALLPARLDAILALVATLDQQRRRAIGLAALGAGVALIWAFAP